MVYLVSYDQRCVTHDYKGLLSLLKELGAKRIQSSVWVLRSDTQATEIHEKLFQAINQKKDRLLVIPIEPDKQYRSLNGANKIGDFKTPTLA